MQLTCLHRAGGDAAIVFFNGWSRDAPDVAGLSADGFDVWEVHDYTSLDCDLSEVVAASSRRILVAWSLGVWAAAKFLMESGIRFDDAVAINGTLRPIDAECGIAPGIFRGTIEHWGEERARERFLLRMAGGRAEFARLPEVRRSPESQQAELAALEQMIVSAPAVVSPFRRAVIGAADRIFPAAAQRNFWRTTGTEIAELPLPHYPFSGLSGWREVTELGRNR